MAYTGVNIDETLKSITNLCQQENVTREKIEEAFKSIDWKKMKCLRNIESAICRSCFGEDISFMSTDIVATTPAIHVQFTEVLNIAKLNLRLNQLRDFLKQHCLSKYFKVMGKLNNFHEITIKYNHDSNITKEEIDDLLVLCKLCFKWNDDSF